MSKQIISKAIGIDLGTTNSAVAMMDTTDTTIIIHRDSITKGETTPSCVWKDPRSGQIVVGRKAFSRIGTLPEPIRSIKRSMGTSTRVLLTNTEATPEEISACTLGEMKQQIEEDVARLGTDSTEWVIDRAIITVPAYFNQPQIDATRRAGEMSGFQVLDLLHEPTAAACYYCWRTGTRNGVFMVYDFGGGTFDVSILRSTAGTFEVLGISGNNRLGGDDIDTVLAQDLQGRLLRLDYALQLDIKNNREDKLRFDKLKLLAEGVKKALSNANEFYLRDTQSLQDKDGQPVDIEILYERHEVEELMRPIVERTLPYCYEALERAEQRAGIKLTDIDAVILAGGSTHIPLVREIVQKEFCTGNTTQEPEAKQRNLVYEKVDTIVAMGAAIRAATIGGLAVYNPERTLRVSFRGVGTTDARETHIAGKVEALNSSLDLSRGHIRLVIADTHAEQKQELKPGGVFGFRGIPLQPGTENLLTFEVYDRNGTLVATAGRPISQSREAPRPTGGSTSTAVLNKAISMDVMIAGKTTRLELIPVLTPLPTSADFQFAHPGNTELIRILLYQHKRVIQEVGVPVSPLLPRGTPIDFNIKIDERYLITANGKIDKETFALAVELPQEREIPTGEQVQTLKKAFDEAIAYLPPGRQALARVRYTKAKESYDNAVQRGDQEQAVHEFEEMEELLTGIERSEGPLDPPKESFDKLVGECYQLNQYAKQATTSIDKPHDAAEIAKSIDALRVQGENAFRDADQTAYSDAIIALQNIHEYLVGLIRTVMKDQDTRTDAQKIAAYIKAAVKEASDIGEFALSQGRKDLEQETEQIKRQLNDLMQNIQHNPQGVQERVSQFQVRLEQIKNLLLSKGKGTEGELPEYYGR